MTAKQIGDKLRELRGDKSLAQIAQETGLTVSALSNYEQGIRVPRDRAKCVLADYFGVQVGSLFFDDNYTKRVEGTSNEQAKRGAGGAGQT